MQRCWIVGVFVILYFALFCSVGHADSPDVLSGEQTAFNSQHAEKQEEVVQHPDHLQKVKVSRSVESKQHAKKQDTFQHNQIAFAVCCPNDIEDVSGLSEQLINSLESAVVQPLQIATAVTPMERINDDESNKLSTELSTENIAIKFTQEAESTVLIVYTLDGEPKFISNLIKQLYLASVRLESSVKTTILSATGFVGRIDKDLTVKWIWPTYRAHFDSDLVEADASKHDTLSRDFGQVSAMSDRTKLQYQRNAAALKRERGTNERLNLQKQQLDILLNFAGKKAWPQLERSSETIRSSVQQLRHYIVVIKSKIQMVQQTQTSLDAMMKSNEREILTYRDSYRRNNQSVAKLYQGLQLLQQRRLDIMRHLSVLVEHLEQTAQVIVVYQVYLREKQKLQLIKKQKGTDIASEQQFVRVDTNSWSCDSRTSNFMCNHRALICHGRKDITAHADASISASVHFEKANQLQNGTNQNFEILVFSNQECEPREVDPEEPFDDVAAIHRCSMQNKKCELESRSVPTTFSKAHKLIDICLYVRCNATNSFPVHATISVTVNSPPSVATKQRDSALRAEHSFTIHNEVETTQPTISNTNAKETTNVPTVVDTDDPKSSSEHLRSLVATCAAALFTGALLIMSIFFIPRI